MGILCFDDRLVYFRAPRWAPKVQEHGMIVDKHRENETENETIKACKHSPSCGTVGIVIYKPYICPNSKSLGHTIRPNDAF